jgi:uncharacterized protein YodC (DUF2158 family)
MQQRRGGPTMTVGKMPESNSDQSGVYCQLFSGKKLEYGHFLPDVLAKAQTEKTKTEK